MQADFNMFFSSKIANFARLSTLKSIHTHLAIPFYLKLYFIYNIKFKFYLKIFEIKI